MTDDHLVPSDPGGTQDEPWFREEHVLFRDQVRRFIN